MVLNDNLEPRDFREEFSGKKKVKKKKKRKEERGRKIQAITHLLKLVVEKKTRDSDSFINISYK